MNYKHDVFLSYAREDENKAKQLTEKLQRFNVNVWKDSKNLESGDLWRRETRKAIRKSEFFMPLLSDTSINKPGFIRTEFDWAVEELRNERFQQRRYILPVVIGDCEISEHFERFNCIRWDTESEHWLSKIVTTIKADKLAQSKVYIGFDLGHGDCSIAYCPQKNRLNIEDLSIGEHKVWPTAIAFPEEEKEAPVIGFDALMEKNFSINFKSANVGAIEGLIQIFVRECFKQCNDLARISQTPKILIVGCPSGWDEKIRGKYEKILRETADSY
uniref:TIR domain-containing protein n=1 Tax=Candidatus Kentrum sp. LPFa TaxID=2126335 RepID=A0A450W6D0_9GAMM|nr:MAG: TIR domain-containing protein [Candidatus Kentron sp. LPFa]